MTEEKEMLEYLGLDDKKELFRDIPERIREDIELPKGKSEMEVIKEVKSILNKNKTLDDFASFLGGGIYRHFIPSSVKEIVGRSEFYTSYTPYQAEISQGMLQSLFEYQSLICELTDMDAANTSMYDYPTALSEAVMMSSRIKRRKGNTFLIPKNIHWEKHSVLDNYLRGSEIEIDYIDYNKESGQINKEDLKEKLDKDTLGFYVETPNAFGVLEEDTQFFADMKDEFDPVFVAGVSPLVLTLMESPANWGADIIVGDSQSMGIPTSFGGPTVGIFACKERYIRRMPGRMIGETEDQEGRTAYCMTLQTREQHIRRERATSNICTNQSLMALASAAYIFLKGGKDLEELAKNNYEKAHILAEKINEIEGYKAPYFNGEFFNEFTIRTPIDSEKLIEDCKKNKVLPGINLDVENPKRFPELPSILLTAATEMNSDEDIELLIDTLKEVTE